MLGFSGFRNLWQLRHRAQVNDARKVDDSGLSPAQIGAQAYYGSCM